MPLRRALRPIFRRGYPVLTPLIRDLYRLKELFGVSGRALAGAISWYFGSREYTNYTYDISAKSKKYLGAFLSNALDRRLGEVSALLQEVEEDPILQKHFLDRIPQTADRHFADLPVRLGRRIGWYAIVRILKPSIVVESGIDRGIGTCVLASALLRNAEEGRGGRVIGLDINPHAGSYVSDPYLPVVELRYGDSLEFLRATDREIDLFIHDSDHSREHETREYDLVRSRLSRQGAILSDNAHETDTLLAFAIRHSMSFSYWQEEVVDHIATPGGIALARRLRYPVATGSTEG